MYVGFPDSSIDKESACQCERSQFNSWVRKIRWRRNRLPTTVLLGFPHGAAGKESAYNAGDLDSIPALGRSPGEGNGYPLQYSGLENSMDYSPWGCKELDMKVQVCILSTYLFDRLPIFTIPILYVTTMCLVPNK